MKKQFSGQVGGEKVLLYIREYPLSFLLKYRIDIITILLFSYFIYFLFLIIEFYVGFGFFLSLLIFFIGFFYLYIRWINTVLIVTNKRILKFVREGFFKGHFKEIKIYNLQENVCNTWDILGKMLDYGNVSFIGKDEKTVIWFRGTKNHNDIAMYVSKLKDFVIENPNYETHEIVEFKNKKERYK